MAERVETVRLTAQVGGYIAGMQSAAAATSKTSGEVDVLAGKTEAIATLGTGFFLFGAAVSAGLIVAVTKMAEFDQKMSQVQTLSHATSDEMSQLSDAALHLGQNIGYSASQVADAEIELTKAGIGVTDQLGGALPGALDLAAAGQLSVADATTIAASAMTQFKLQGKDVPHIADLLAAGADKALGSVQDLGEGLKYVGPIANSMGISIEQTVGTLSLLAQNGILGSKAGTELRGVLSSLTSPSQQASAVMKQYGINLYDATGHFIGFDGAAQQLKDHLGGLDQATRQQALGQIFGNQQIVAATILMDGGAKTVDKWTKAVNDSGFAAQQASGKMDNLKGDISKLQAAVDTGLIESATGANGALRGLVQGLTSVITSVSNLPEPVLQTGFALGGLVGTITLLGSGALVVVPKILAFKQAVEVLAGGSEALQSKLSKVSSFLAGPWGIALAGAAIVTTAYWDSQLKAGQGVDQLTDSLNQQTGAVTKNTRALIIKQLQDQGTYDAAKKAGISIQEVNDAVFKGGAALDSYNKKTAAYYATVGVGGNIVRTFNGEESALADGVNVARENIDKAKDSHKNLSEAQGQGAESANSNASAIAGVTSSADDATDSIQNLADQLRGLDNGALDTRAASRAYQAAIDDLTASVKENGRTLDENTDKGRSNEAALDSIAKSALDYAGALYQQTGSQQQASAAIADGRQHLIDALAQFGITGQAAQDYANQLGLIPSNIPLSTADAQKALQDALDKVTILHAALNQIDGPTIRFTPGTASVARATGGIINGPGTGTSDSILARVSAGEFVATAAATANPANRRALEYMNAGGTVRGYADGGYVSPSYYVAPMQPVGASSGSLEGARITGTLDLGNGLTGFIDGRIAAADKTLSTGLSTGRQKDTF